MKSRCLNSSWSPSWCCTPLRLRPPVVLAPRPQEARALQMVPKNCMSEPLLNENDAASKRHGAIAAVQGSAGGKRPCTQQAAVQRSAGSMLTQRPEITTTPTEVAKRTGSPSPPNHAGSQQRPKAHVHAAAATAVIDVGSTNPDCEVRCRHSL